MAIIPINGPSSPQAPAGAAPVRAPSSAPEASDGAETTAAEDAVSVDSMSMSPPPEVMAAIATASAAYDQLAAQGLHVSFGTDADTGGLALTLEDHHGSTLSSLKPSEVLALADGHPPTQPGSST